jgi:rhodanese-related sulfurtransferase
MTYAGDVTPSDAWSELGRDKAAQLVDVRTKPEWQFVGIPDLAPHGKKTVLLAWQDYPAMQLNSAFIEQLGKAVPDRDAPLFFLCRSGARSKAAAVAATQAGYKRCYNVLDGFEGGLDPIRHRGKAGWKAVGLPWVQD